MTFLIGELKRMRLYALALYAHRYPIIQNKILFWSEQGHRYSCNPRYLTEYILEKHPDAFELVWMFDRDAEIPDNLPAQVRVVRFFSKEWLYELATAKYIVCNHRIPEYFLFYKRKHQVYIQTWHSSLRLKTIEKDAQDTLGEKYVQSAKVDSGKIDWIISGCSFSSDIFRNSFWYSGKILQCGTPRIDALLQLVEKRDFLCEKMKLDDGLKYILYAPTFRNCDGDSLQAYNVDFARLTKALEQRLGGEWKVLYRLHPNVAKHTELQELPSNCINMTFYHDMQELLAISDVLLTDYSSSMFDVAYLGKMCMLYVSDLEQYVAKERRLYFDIKALPFPIATNNEILEKNVLQFEEKEYRDQIQDFMGKIGSFETGSACQMITRQIFGV